MQRVVLILAALAFTVVAALPAHADDSSLRDEIAQLRAQLQQLKAEVDQLKQDRAQTAAVATASTAPSTMVQPTAAPAAAATTMTPAPNAPVAPAIADTTTLWGYGELNYNRPQDGANAVGDVRRAVLGFGHAFDDKTRVLGEFEWEHAVVSADDQGESEVEQLFVEHQIRPQFGVRAGLVLIPLGLLNEHHEPGNYYGVERNFVETAIIPSTWREGGVVLYGNTDSGFNWSTGITTGFDLGKWDPASDEARESPLGSIHQELQLAKAHDASEFAAANWQGIPGLTVGGGVFTGKIGQGQKDFPANDSRLVLGEGHVRWQSGRFDVSGLYARGHISDTEALNLTFIGNPNPVPESFWGAYAQGAVRVWEHGDAALTPFARYEEFNTASSYEPVPLGLGVAASPTEKVWTAGANYWLTRGVVLKADYQFFKLDHNLNRFDLGVGYQF